MRAHAYALVCKHPADIFLWFPVGPDAQIVIGAVRDVGRSEEPELVAALRSMGHQVTFVAADNSGSASPTSDVA